MPTSNPTSTTDKFSYGCNRWRRAGWTRCWLRLADAGFRVTLFERRPYLGGRASSYQHPGTGEVVDNCQHVLLGCCTNLLDFYNVPA